MLVRLYTARRCVWSDELREDGSGCARARDSAENGEMGVEGVGKTCEVK